MSPIGGMRSKPGSSNAASPAATSTRSAVQPRARTLDEPGSSSPRIRSSSTASKAALARGDDHDLDRRVGRQFRRLLGQPQRHRIAAELVDEPLSLGLLARPDTAFGERLDRVGAQVAAGDDTRLEAGIDRVERSVEPLAAMRRKPVTC